MVTVYTYGDTEYFAELSCPLYNLLCLRQL